MLGTLAKAKSVKAYSCCSTHGENIPNCSPVQHICPRCTTDT